MSCSTPPRVLVIGAGPAGLVALNTLVEQGFDAVCFESENAVGGTFRTKCYDDGRLVSSKFLTAFSDFRFGIEDEDHPLITEYLKYLERYCDYKALWPRIHFGTTVVDLLRRDDVPGAFARWSYSVRVSKKKSEGEKEMMFDAVSVCSGLHNNPYTPRSLMEKGFDGEMLHSSTYKNKEIFRNKRVLVIGAGETGLDLVYRAIQVSDSVTLNTRSGFLSVPYVIGNGIPLDTFISNLFESSHMHWWLQHLKFKWCFTTPFIRLAFLLGTGSPEGCGYNQYAGCKPSAAVQRGHLIINKSTNAMPWINRGAGKQTTLLGRMVYGSLDDSPLFRELGLERKVDVKQCDIADILGKTVIFSDGSAQEFDIIACATGYKVSFPFLSHLHNVKKEGKNGPQQACQDEPRTTLREMPEQDQLPEEHNILNSNEVTLSFIGFIRPNVGAIPPMAELQTMYWIQRLRGKVSKSKLNAPVTYKLLGLNDRTGAYGVDYGAYMHDLARAIDADPSIRHMLFRSPKTCIAWALGQAYPTFFRLRGPFACDKAWEISNTELYGIVWDRPLASNAIFVLLIGLFAILNGVAFILETVVNILSKVVLYFLGKR